MKNIIILIVLLGLSSCNQNQGSKKKAFIESNSAETLLAKFPVLRKSNEALHFYNQKKDIEQFIPDSIIKNSLPTSIIEDIRFQGETAKHQIYIQLPLDDNHIACIINSNESWYKKQSLLVFDKQTKAFKKVMMLSQFYGGDGGQVVNESWLYSEDNQTYLYQKESSHALIMNGTSGEPEEFLEESSHLYLWNKNSFEKTIMKDSVQLSNQYKLKWKW